LIVALGVVSILVALAFDVTRYEHFLLLIGAVFVPLFGVLAADYFVTARGRYDPAAVLEASGRGGVVPGVRWQGALAWALGTAVYLWISGRLELLGLAGLPVTGASLPSLAVSAGAYLAVAGRARDAGP
jgi:NCS1 family nucleobase:cation symporter-1